MPFEQNSYTGKEKKEYHEYCIKSKSNNIIFCPKKIIKGYKDKQKKDEQGNLLYKRVQRANDYFKSLGGKSKKGKTEKKYKVFSDYETEYSMNTKMAVDRDKIISSVFSPTFLNLF